MSQPAERVLQEALELTYEEQLELAYQLLRAVRGRSRRGDGAVARLEKQAESLEVTSLTERPTSVLEELWDNEADAVYDEM